MTKLGYDDDEQYEKIISLLRDVKLVHSPEGLNSTLLRHKKIREFLFKYQKRAIIDLESNL